LAVTSLLFIPFGLAVIWSADQTRRERERELQEQAGAVATTAAAYLDQYLSGFDQMASALARHPAVTGLTRGRIDELLAAMLRDQPLLLNVVVTDRDGGLVGTGLPERAQIGNAVSMPYVRDVVRNAKPVVSELTTGQVSGKPTIILAYPIFGGDRAVTGVLGFGIDLTRLQSVLASVPLPEGSVITITDSASRVLARSRDAERFIGTVTDAQALPPEQVSPTRVRVGLDGIPRFYGNAFIARGPWLVSVGIPTSVATSRIAPLWRRNLLIAFVAVATLMILSLSLSTHISHGMKALSLAAQRIARGDLSPPERTPVSNRELAELQDSFTIMAANLRQAQQALDHQVEQERKMRETLQSLQRQVVRQERLAAVGVLVSGVAHELNNPLQAILGTVELLERQGNLSKAALDEIAFVKTQSGRAREIIRNLSRFSSQQSGPPALVDLRDVVGEVVQLRQRDLITSSIALEIDMTATRKVYANFTELEQVTLNFVINAQQSIEAVGRATGRILIRVYDAGKKVRLEVQDDGPGVSPEDEAKLFQPFFTTKPVGKGTGLGLSVSYGIIESYGGIIGHHGNEWGGATFYFELPVSEPAARLVTPSTSGAASKADDRPPLLRRSVSPGL
jgi:C4-dicarboxylate-specific signal transduction histidine kinase